MRHLWHKTIVWYLRRCWGAFHCYPYGNGGKYVVLMSDAQYRTWQDCLELAGRVIWWQKCTKRVSATNDRLKAENAWLRQKLEWQTEWIMVKDRLPEKNDYYFVAWEFNHRVLTGEAWYDGENGWLLPDYGGCKEVTWPPPAVLCWMYVPAVPLITANKLLKA